MPSATITYRFANQILRLKQIALITALEAVGARGRAWHIPVEYEWDGDPLALGGTTFPFDRAELAALYAVALLTPAGSGGDVMCLKVQHDYLGMQERAFHTRHMTPIRAVLHAGARRAGHATVTYGTFDRVSRYAADLLVAGAAGWIPPQPPV